MESRPASGVVPPMNDEESAMWDRLQFVSFKTLQDAMVQASIPGAAATSWKIDLITLAIDHKFNYICVPKRLTKPLKPTAPRPAPAPSNLAPDHHQFAAIPPQTSTISSNQPPAPAVSSQPKGGGVKRALVEPAFSPVVSALPVVPANQAMGVAGYFKSLMEAKWTQVFEPTPLIRGFNFPGEFSFEEIRIHIQKIALESGCLFWKTDTGTTESSDGYIHSMSFQCPHYPDPAYYSEKKGRKNTDDSAESWRNEPRKGLHVTGTKCQARFTINGKKSETSESKFVWRVSPYTRAKFSMEHSGHPEPYAKYMQKMALSLTEKTAITHMVNSGMASNQISAYLSENGRKGAISKQTIGFISSEISKWDIELSVIRAKSPGVSAAQALVQNLQALPNCTVILLYKDLQSSENQLTSMIAGKIDVFKVSAVEMDDVSQEKKNASISDGLHDDVQPEPSVLVRTWAACCAAWKTLVQPHEPIRGNAPPRVQPTTSENDQNRILIIDGKPCLLLALLWAFDEEKVMFSKYPEVLHHDVKGKVCQWAMPWWFSVGVNGRRGNFIALRGWIHNESRAMFRFCEKALIHVHGKFLKFLVCHCCDGDPDLIAVLLSMCAAGGSSPWARLVRCFWHIENRGIIHEFKNLTDPWIKQLISILWRTCVTLETPQEFETVWTWVVDVWTPRVCGKVKGLPVGEQCNATQASLLPDFLERIYISREHWCLAWKLTIPAMNTAVNTRAETENGVLTKHVKVSGAMAPGKMAEGEARVTSSSYQRETRDDFAKLIRQRTGENECEKLMTASSFEIQHHQVCVAQQCFNEGSSSIELCTEAMEDCEICRSNMLPHQGGIRKRDQHPLWFPEAIHDNILARFHVKISYVEPVSHPREVTTHVGAESVYASCPWPLKRTRVVTIHSNEGKIFLLCSCANDIREMCACRHVSIILGCITDQASWGEEAIAIHIRNLIAYSYWNVVADLPPRRAYDFMGTATLKISKADLEEYNSIKELITKSTIPFDVAPPVEGLRLGVSTCSMRQAKKELQDPFNKLCNNLFKKICSANTLTGLQTNSVKGMNGLRSLISEFPDAAVTSGDSTRQKQLVRI